MATTAVPQVISPVLLTEAVQGAFASKTAFAGSLAQRLGIVAINDSFPMAGPGAIGQTVRIPYFSSIGEFQDNVSDGVAATTKQMSETSEDGTVQRGTLGWEVSRWAKAASNIQGGKDIYQESGELAVQSALRYMDRKIIDAAVAGTNQLVLDKYSSTVPRNLDWQLLCDGLGAWGDFGTLDEVAGIAVHSKTMIDLLKLTDSTGRPLLVQPTMADVPPMLLGKPLIVSDRLPVDNSNMSAVTSAGTTPPVITLTNTANRENGTGPVRPISLQINCTTLGARGTWVFKYSIDGGQTFATVATGILSAATVALVDPLDPAGGLLGVTVNIAAGTAATDNIWTAQTILKHTTLLLKKNALVFWYNRAAMEVATINVPLADTVQAATHMYLVAYRYNRMAGQPYPGVVKIRHNAGGL